MGMILHDWNLEQKMHLIRAAYDALPPGGALVAIEALIDDARRENAFGLLMSLNMLIEFGDAFDYTGADFAGGADQQVGFRSVQVVPWRGPHRQRSPTSRACTSPVIGVQAAQPAGPAARTRAERDDSNQEVHDAEMPLSLSQ